MDYSKYMKKSGEEFLFYYFSSLWKQKHTSEISSFLFCSLPKGIQEWSFLSSRIMVVFSQSYLKMARVHLFVLRETRLKSVLVEDREM